MLTSVSKGRAFGGPLALPLRLRLVWLERYADAITDRLGQPPFNVGGYSGQNVASLSCGERLRCESKPNECPYRRSHSGSLPIAHHPDATAAEPSAQQRRSKPGPG